MVPTISCVTWIGWLYRCGNFSPAMGLVRGHSFHGKRVKKFSEIQAQYEDFVIVTAFAARDEPTMETIFLLDQQYELYAPDVPVAGEDLFDRDFFISHLSQAQAAYRLWADERSRQIYRDLIAYKLTGKIKYLASTVCSRQEVFSSLLRLGPAESYVDLGAYNGDTIEEFLRYTGGRFSARLCHGTGSEKLPETLSAVRKLGPFSRR